MGTTMTATRHDTLAFSRVRRAQGSKPRLPRTITGIELYAGAPSAGCGVAQCSVLRRAPAHCFSPGWQLFILYAALYCHYKGNSFASHTLLKHTLRRVSSYCPRTPKNNPHKTANPSFALYRVWHSNWVAIFRYMYMLYVHTHSEYVCAFVIVSQLYAGRPRSFPKMSQVVLHHSRELILYIYFLNKDRTSTLHTTSPNNTRSLYSQT